MAENPRANGIEVSAEEARFLRRFVRRELLPWLAGVAALAGLALAAALLAPAHAAFDAAPTAGGARSDPSGSDAAALAELRAEYARLRADFTALERALADARSAPVAGSTASETQSDAGARALDARLRERFEARVSQLESALATRTTRVSHDAAGDTAPALPGDLNAIRERLYNLEMRQDRKDQESAALQQDVLARLFDLERASQSEAAARLDNLQTGEQRLEKLELRVGQLEHRPAPSSAPAAPAASQ